MTVSQEERIINQCKEEKYFQETAGHDIIFDMTSYSKKTYLTSTYIIKTI